MRIDSQPPPIIAVKERREVKGPTAVFAIKPVAEEERSHQEAGKHRDTQGTSPYQTEQRGYVVDRRKLCRRVSKQAVLIELRSGVDRRRVDQRDGDERIHIDAQA